MNKRVKILVYDKAGKGRKKFKCDFCKRVRYKIKSRIKVGKLNLDFCNSTCKNNAQRIGGILAPKHAGKSKDYRRKALREKINVCNRCGYKRRTDILQVHHMDENRQNNHINNLEILCPNCHVSHHMRAKKNKRSSIKWEYTSNQIKKKNMCG